MVNDTLNYNSTSVGTNIILIAICSSSRGILLNFLLLIIFIHRIRSFKQSNKNTSCRISLLHTRNTYIHLTGILSTLYGDLYLTIRDAYPISWHCHFLGYLLSLFGSGVYGSCFLQAIFRYWRIMFSNYTLL